MHCVTIRQGAFLVYKVRTEGCRAAASLTELAMQQVHKEASNAVYMREEEDNDVFLNSRKSFLSPSSLPYYPIALDALLIVFYHLIKIAVTIEMYVCLWQEQNVFCYFWKVFQFYYRKKKIYLDFS